nr:uncharacterized protein LOC108083031 [Drosophila kikkawai]
MRTMCERRIVCISISISCLILFYFIFFVSMILKIYIQLVYVLFGFLATVCLLYGASRENLKYLQACFWLMLIAIIWAILVSLKRIVETTGKRKAYVYDAIVIVSAIALIVCDWVVYKFAKEVNQR